MSENGPGKDKRVGIPSEDAEKKVSQLSVLTYEAVNEQKEGFIAHPHNTARRINSASSWEGYNTAA